MTIEFVADKTYWRRLEDGTIQLRTTPLDITFPAAGEVNENADAFGYSDSLITPTRVEPAANEVKLGVVFSDPESPITGTYTGEAVPIAKGKLVGVDNGDGTMTFTISEGSSLAINRVYFAAVKATGELTWVLAGTRTGNGTLTATIPNGAYWAFVRSSWE